MFNEKHPKRPPLMYYGGGFRRAKKIIALMPNHDAYLEPCFGAGGVFIKKSRAKYETVNDADSRVTNFFRVLRDSGNELLDLINLTPWAENEYKLTAQVADDPLEDARRFFFLCWMSIKGGPVFENGFRFQKNPQNRYSPPPFDALSRDDLLVTAERLKGVQILNRDGLTVIDMFIKHDVLIYFDPPYVSDTRKRKRGYNVEPGQNWHREAARLLTKARGPVLVSGYWSPLYVDLYENAGFVRVDFQQRTNGRRIGKECVWMSPLAAELVGRS
ncbi:MAG: hypothetical protein CUN56_00050 [Phototrophicales bacterium]|nr:MAG: hypothetical protein CUN56_00050 [Phototrophicales bacterium]